MALALTGIHELTVIRGKQRQSEAVGGNQRLSESIRCNRRQRNQMLFDVLCVADSCCWAHGPAGLGVLGVETVDTVTGGNRRKKASFFDVSGNNKCGYVNVREITGHITGQYGRASACRYSARHYRAICAC